MIKGLKPVLMSALLLIILGTMSIRHYASNKVLTNEVTEQSEASGNNYEKYTGEKISLNVQSERMSGPWGELKLTPFILEPTKDFLTEQIYFNDTYNMFSSSKQWVLENTAITSCTVIPYIMVLQTARSGFMTAVLEMR